MIDPAAFKWPAGQRAAVSLTYDDSLPCHYETLCPQLESRGQRATFFLCLSWPGFMNHPARWREAAAKGHELGNHTLYHACRREPPEHFGWLPAEYDLCDYTVRRWRDEVTLANFILAQVDGKTERTFGNPCGCRTIGRGANVSSLDPMIGELFVAGRHADVDRLVDPTNPQYPGLGCYGGDGKIFDQLKGRIDEALDAAAWLILVFHGVGKGTHGLYSELADHWQMLDYLAGQRDRIWTAPMIDVAKHLKSLEPK